MPVEVITEEALGAEPHDQVRAWYRAATGAEPPPNDVKQSAGLQIAARVWRKLPLGVTRFMGPRLIKHFS